MTTASQATDKYTDPSITEAIMVDEEHYPIALPALEFGQKFDVRAIRDPMEHWYLAIIYLTNAIVFVALIALVVTLINYPDAFLQLVPLIVMYTFAAVVYWVSLKLFYYRTQGNSIAASPLQYPQIYRMVKEASKRLGIDMPKVLILNGHGQFELLIAKRFTKYGIVTITSKLVNELSERPDEFMMIVGRQLGQIKAGHFRLWFLKYTIGCFAHVFYLAWRRRCAFTADRIGMLIAGDSYAAEQALCSLTAGAKIAPSTRYGQIEEQRKQLLESNWAWVALSLSAEPYMIDRIVRLRRYAEQIGEKGAPKNVGTLGIDHYKLKSTAVLIIHGHDRMARLELENFLYSEFPQVAPRVMISTFTSGLTMPEKFERIVNDVRGAIALLTPDDVARLAIQDAAVKQERARQNVIMEIGWAWGKLGRQRVLLLVRGKIEIPSDLTGIELHCFNELPSECAESVRKFISYLERGS